MGSIEGKSGELEGKIDELDDFCQEPEELRESWLERNVAAEGEVVVLREWVDQQERTILERQVECALNFIHDFRIGHYTVPKHSIPGTHTVYRITR